MKQATTDKDNTERYSYYGMTALIPGIQQAVDTLLAMLNDMKIQIAAYQGRESGSTVSVNEGPLKAERLVQGLTTRGKPMKMHPRDPAHPGHAKWIAKVQRAKKMSKEGKVRQRSGIKGYWAAMTPEERSKEMKRRAAKATRKKTAAMNAVVLQKGVAA